MRHLNAGHAGQHFRRHQLRRAGTGKCHHGGFGLGHVHKLFQILSRHFVVHSQNEGHRAHVTNGRKGGVLVIGQFLHQAFERGIGAVGANQNGVAIGSRFGHRIGAQHAVDAGFVFNHDGLSQYL